MNLLLDPHSVNDYFATDAREAGGTQGTHLLRGTVLAIFQVEAFDACVAVSGLAGAGVEVGDCLDGVEGETAHLLEEALSERDGGSAHALAPGDVAFNAQLELRVFVDVIDESQTFGLDGGDFRAARAQKIAQQVMCPSRPRG